MRTSTQSHTCSKHDRRVAGVGATSDGSDDNRSMCQGVFLAIIDKWHFCLKFIFWDSIALEHAQVHVCMYILWKALLHPPIRPPTHTLWFLSKVIQFHTGIFCLHPYLAHKKITIKLGVSVHFCCAYHYASGMWCPFCAGGFFLLLTGKCQDWQGTAGFSSVWPLITRLLCFGTHSSF